MTKRISISIAAAILLCAALVTATVSYLSYRPAGIVNSFTAGYLKAAVHEGSFEQVGEGIWAKEVQGKNEGSVPAYLRISLVPMFLYEGKITSADITLGMPVDGYNLLIKGPGGEDVTLYFDNSVGEQTWDYRDGIYYYKQPVPAGDMTPLLLTAVSSTNADFNWENFQLQVIVEAVQVQGTYEESWQLSQE